MRFFALALAGPVAFTFRSQHLSPVGRHEWIVNETRVAWEAHETAIVVVDMWDKHWCDSATTRVAEIAVPMQQTIAAARNLGFTVIWAPSDVTDFYAGSAVRNHTLGLNPVALPQQHPVPDPTLPLSTATDGGCDTTCTMRKAWSRQIATLEITTGDFLIEDAPHGTQELWNILQHQGIRQVLYMGVHENMCLLDRSFAIKELRALGYPQDRVAVVRELVDVMYTPQDPPYVPHAEGLALHTAYVEKFYAGSVSMYDLLVPSYDVAIV